ncbi:MAG TPA: SWIM zinc finger family protein, partial [Steroidobacteraceae bacterium]|nr:SWIM zinc finger family protein [Steroidobacteraceae bacterium]
MSKRQQPLLSQLLSEESLLQRVDPRVFDRGQSYFEGDAVVDLVDTGMALKAKVQGGDEYRVRLWADQGEIQYECTCPYGADDFCKHAVAVGLAWLARGNAAPAKATADSDLTTIREWLKNASRETLMELLAEQAENESELRHRLYTLASRERLVAGKDDEALKDVVNKAFNVGAFVDWRAIPRLCDRVSNVADLLKSLIEANHPSSYSLTHRAFTRGLAVYVRTDDSSGRYGAALAGLANLLLLAAQRQSPAQDTLGKHLFKLILDDQWDMIEFESYRPLLGLVGTKVFRTLAEKEWKKVPTREPRESEQAYDGSNFGITSIMEMLAHMDNDFDALVDIKSRDLRAAYRYLEIAELLQSSKRHDEALAWAERGHIAFAAKPDARLSRFVADEYARRGRHDDAIKISWEQFIGQPTLSHYRFLKECADRAADWTEWRDKALKEIRIAIAARGDRKANQRPWDVIDHSLLVEIFLWEGDSTAALSEAKNHGCRASLWSEIAEAREGDFPNDAVEIYRSQLDGIIRLGNNHAYDEAVKLIDRIGSLMTRALRVPEFEIWVADVRARH